MKNKKDKKHDAPRNYVVLALIKRGKSGSGSHKKTKRKIQRELIKLVEF
jgi:hypothetical protein